MNRRLEEQGKGKDKSSGSKGKGWENSDSWWNDDDRWWYENTGYENNWWEAVAAATLDTKRKEDRKEVQG